MADEEAAPGILRRTAGVGRALVGVHLELAQKEAAEDAGRVASGAIALAVVAAFLGSALLLVDVSLVALVHRRYALELPLAALAVAAGHLVIALPIALWAIPRLKQPVLQRTRDRVKETVSALKG